MKDSHFKSITDSNHLTHLPNTHFWGMLGTRLCTSASLFFLRSLTLYRCMRSFLLTGMFNIMVLGISPLIPGHVNRGLSIPEE